MGIIQALMGVIQCITGIMVQVIQATTHLPPNLSAPIISHTNLRPGDQGQFLGCGTFETQHGGRLGNFGQSVTSSLSLLEARAFDSKLKLELFQNF